MNAPEEKSRLQIALEYLERGWSVIPLCSPDHSGCPPSHTQTCTRPGKGAIVKWKQFQTHLPSPSLLKKTFKTISNIGIVMGNVSGLVGLDIDGASAWKWYFELAEGQHQDTLGFLTPGGRRLLYRIPQGVYIPKKRFDGPKKCHVIILGEGAYTVAPPSVHLSGKTYGPWEGELRDCPAWILDLATEPNEEQDDQSFVCDVPDADDIQVTRAKAYLAKCDPCISGHKGHNQAFKIACKLIHGFHLSDEQALAIILMHFNPICEPPWTIEEWRHKIQDARANGQAADMGEPKAMEVKEKIPAAWKIKFITEVQEPGPKQWLVEGLVPKLGITLFSAKPKCGKTTFLATLLAALEEGQTFCELPTAKTRALIVSEEPEEYWWIRNTWFNYQPFHQLNCLPFSSKPDLKEWDKYCDWLLSQKLTDTGLVVLDTLSGLGPMESENDNAEVGKYFPAIRRIAQSGSSVLILHHHGHNSSRPRGASAIVQSVDAYIDFSYYGNDEESPLRTLKVKGRMPGLIKSMTIEFDEESKVYEQVTVDEPDKPKLTVETVILEIVPTQTPGWTAQQFFENWPSDAETPALKTIQNALTKLAKADQLSVEKDAKPRRYFRAK